MPPADEADRVVKKLKSAQDNLEIIVGKEKIVYRYPAAIMAMYSNYIDAMLSLPMKESESLSISFPDICPKDWELMITFLQPLYCENMTYDDAKCLARLYDKYDFPDGRTRCDQAVQAIFPQSKAIQNISLEVEAFAVADESNLLEARNKGVVHFGTILQSRTGRLALQADHIAKLVPILQKDDTIWTALASCMNLSCEDRHEVLSNPLFPLLCEKNLRLLDLEHTVMKHMTRIKVSGAGCKEVNGIYTRDSSSSKTYTRVGDYGGYVDVPFFLSFEDSKWKIFCEQDESSDDEEDEGWVAIQKAFYHCDGSLETDIPPRNGYVAVEAGSYPSPLVSFLPTKQLSDDAGQSTR